MRSSASVGPGKGSRGCGVMVASVIRRRSYCQYERFRTGLDLTREPVQSFASRSRGRDMFSESAELYDLIYSSFKNYEAETSSIAALLRSANPACSTVLDVACGTGEHARLLGERHGFEVDGIDLEPAFVRIAAGKNPAGTFTVADMTDFHLGRRYDAVICLFSSIGYVRTLDRLSAALRCFREHVEQTGVVVVE